VNPRRLFFAFFVVLLAGLTVLVGVFSYQTRQEYVRLRAMNLETRRQLLEAQARLEQQETILRRLKTDPAYVERVIRAKLGYAKPDEFIFRLQE
jgi:cell division protein DivIC